MIHSERSVYALRALPTLIGATLLMAGCAADATGGSTVTTEDPASSASTAQAVQTKPVAELRAEAIKSAATTCSPATCCFPAGGGWEDNPFEDGLRKLGCTTPGNYSEALGTSANWWLYTRCPPSLELAKLVSDYSNVAPYDARFIDNVCLELTAIVIGQWDAVFVEFDPTCETCIVSSL
jgi:hypothetical protein